MQLARGSKQVEYVEYWWQSAGNLWLVLLWIFETPRTVFRPDAFVCFSLSPGGCGFFSWAQGRWRCQGVVLSYTGGDASCLSVCLHKWLFLRPKRAAPDLLLPIWMSTRLGLPAPWSRCLGGGISRQMPSALFSCEVTGRALLLAGWWCTSRGTAGRPPQARSGSRAAASTWPGAWTSSSATSCGKCRASWVNRSLLPGPSLLTLPGLGFFYSRWRVIAGERSATLSWMCSSKISTCLPCPPSYFASVSWWRQGAG